MLQEIDIEIDRHEAVVAESKAMLDAAKAALTGQVSRYGAALSLKGDAANIALVREMYWDYPAVSVASLADLLNVRGSNGVHAYVGPSRAPIPCRGGCGNEVVREVTSRAGANSRISLQRWCNDCQAEREVKWAEQSRRSRAEAEAELEEFRVALAEGRKPTAVYVELPGVHGTWRVDESRLADLT